LFLGNASGDGHFLVEARGAGGLGARRGPAWIRTFKGIVGAVVSYGLIKMLWENFLNVRPVNLIFRYFVLQDIFGCLEAVFPGPAENSRGRLRTSRLGHLIDYPFWGCDIKFPEYVNPNLIPVRYGGELCLLRMRASTS